MNCAEIKDELSAYIDGELPPARRADVEAHVAGCPQCRQQVAELRQLAAGVAAMPKMQPAPQFLAEVRGKLARGERPESRPWQDVLFHPFWPKVPLELVAVAAALMVVSRFSTQPTPQEIASEGHFAKAESREEAAQPAKEAVNRGRMEPETPAAPAASASRGNIVAMNGAVTTEGAGNEVRADAVSQPTQQPAMNDRDKAEHGEIAAPPVALEVPAGARERAAKLTSDFSPEKDRQLTLPQTAVDSVGAAGDLAKVIPAPASPSPASVAPVETIKVVSADVAGLKQRALELARSLGGGEYRAIEESGGEAKMAGDRFVVAVPETQAASFKRQLPWLGSAVPSMMLDDGRPAGAKIIRGGGVVNKPKESVPVVLIEIQVVPPPTN